MKTHLLAAAIAAGTATSALAAQTYIHAGRLMAVPGQAVRGPSTIVVDNGRIVSVTDGLARIEPSVPDIGQTTKAEAEARHHDEDWDGGTTER